MDKETLSNYGWIVICILVLSVMIALATPFGNYVSNAVKSTATGLNDTSDKAMSVIGLNGKGEWDDSSNNGGGGNTPTTETKRDSGTLIPDGATYTKADGTVLEGNGTNKFPDTPATRDKYEESDYIYSYNLGTPGDDGSYGTEWSVVSKISFAISQLAPWDDESSVEQKSQLSPILTEIAGKPITNMNGTFYKCYALTTSPKIPSTVTNVYRAYQYCKELVEAPSLPDGITDMYCTFYDCEKLKVAPTIPDSVTTMHSTFDLCSELTTIQRIPGNVRNLSNTFDGCENLTGTIIIDANPSTYNNCFNSTVKSIILTGSSTKLSSLAATAKNGNVTVK